MTVVPTASAAPLISLARRISMPLPSINQLRAWSRNAACTAASSALRKRERSFLVSAAGPRVFVPSSRRCRAISRPARALPIFAGVHCLPVGETTRAPFLRQRDASGISEVTHTFNGRDVLCNPVISRICGIADQDHSYVRGARRPDWSRAIGDNENVKPKTSRYAVDLLPHRARITIDVDVNQTPACCFSTTAIPAALTTASALGFP